MGHITPEEKEKIIQLFNTQEVDNLLLVYNLLQGFGINILDCDWLIKPYITDNLEDYCYDIKIPMLVTCYADHPNYYAEFKKLMICRFYSWDSNQSGHRWKVQLYSEHTNNYYKNDYFKFKTDKTDDSDSHYLDFIYRIKYIYYLWE